MVCPTRQHKRTLNYPIKYQVQINQNFSQLTPVVEASLSNSPEQTTTLNTMDTTPNLRRRKVSILCNQLLPRILIQIVETLQNYSDIFKVCIKQYDVIRIISQYFLCCELLSFFIKLLVEGTSCHFYKIVGGGYLFCVITPPPFYNL